MSKLKALETTIVTTITNASQEASMAKKKKAAKKKTKKKAAKKKKKQFFDFNLKSVKPLIAKLEAFLFLGLYYDETGANRD